MPNAFFWYDVMTTDTTAAGRFYSELVGWGLQDSGSPGYTALTVGGMAVAGLMPIPEDAAKMGARPAWMGYIHVEDVPATVAAIRKEGGKLLKGPVEVPGIIVFAVVADPQGSGFLVASPIPKVNPPRPAPGAPGTFGWHELFAQDWNAVWPFYEKLFGWTKDTSFDMGQMGTYQLFRAGGETPVGAMMTKTADMPASFWNFYVNVPSVGAAAEKLAALGGKVVMGPHEVPGGQWVLQAFDPQGAFFSLLSPVK